MGGSDAFQKFLFVQRAVYVDGLSELASTLHLLDVLIKTDTDGFILRNPVVTKAGSVIELATPSTSKCPDLEEFRNGLARFEVGKGSRMFNWKAEGDIEQNFSSAKSFKGSLIAGPLLEATLNFFSEAKSLTCRLENVEKASMTDKNKLVDLIAKGNWKPNVEKASLKWHDQKRSGNKLWVVHEILYASKLEITSAESASAGARVFTAVAPNTLGGSIEVSHESGPNSMVRTIGKNSNFPGKFMFAFRAIRFQFDAKGNVIKGSYKENVGSERITTRTRDDDALYGDEVEQIKDLFVDINPGKNFDFEDEEAEEMGMQALGIQEFADC